MNKSNGVSTGVLVVALLLLAAGPLMAEEASQQRPMAYVVCGDGNFQDNRVYRVDLLAGEVKGVSDPLDWMGKPQHLSFDPVHSRLYIASMRGKAADYWPVTVVRVRDSQFEIVNRFTTAANDTLPRGAGETCRMKSGEPYWSPLNTKLNEAYKTVVSPDGNELFVSHGGLADKGKSAAVWDTVTGKVLRLLPYGMRPSQLWSPDGNRVAAIWTAGEREREENGKVIARSWPGGVSVINVQTGERVTTYLTDNKGLHPPWSKVEWPLIRVHGSGRLQAFDRDTGQVISEFNVEELTGLTTHYGGVVWSPPLVLDGKQAIILNMRCYERAADKGGLNCQPPTFEELPNIIEHTYIVVIDVLQQTEKSRTEVGTDCTNSVLAYE